MRKGMDIELKVGLFVTLGLALIMLSILLLGGTESFFTRKARFTAHFNNVEGLVQGAKVVLGGVSIGTVESVALDEEHRNIQVNLQVTKAQSDWIRADSQAEIQTQGVLGDKFIAISRGSDTEPPLPPGSDIQARPSAGLTQFISKSDQLLVTLQSIASSMDRMLKGFESKGRSEIFFEGMAKTAKNLSSATERLNQEVEDLHFKQVSRNLNGILEKINNGTGTLGALVNDPGLYDDVKALMGGANRNRVVRNLVRQSIRKGEEAEASEAQASPTPTPARSK